LRLSAFAGYKIRFLFFVVKNSCRHICLLLTYLTPSNYIPSLPFYNDYPNQLFPHNLRKSAKSAVKQSLFPYSRPFAVKKVTQIGQNIRIFDFFRGYSALFRKFSSTFFTKIRANPRPLAVQEIRFFSSVICPPSSIRLVINQNAPL